MKKVFITEQQFLEMCRKESSVNGGEAKMDMRQRIIQMRNDTSDFKEGELKLLARRHIDRAFWLGTQYYKNLLDIESRAKILKQLDKMNRQIDDVPI